MQISFGGTDYPNSFFARGGLTMTGAEYSISVSITTSVYEDVDQLRTLDKWDKSYGKERRLVLI